MKTLEKGRKTLMASSSFQIAGARHEHGLEEQPGAH